MRNFELKRICKPSLHDHETVEQFVYVAKDDVITDEDIEEVLLDIIARHNITEYVDFMHAINNERVTFIDKSYLQPLNLRNAFKEIVKSKGYKTDYKSNTDAGKYFEDLKDIVKMRCLNLKTIPQNIELRL